MDSNRSRVDAVPVTVANYYPLQRRFMHGTYEGDPCALRGADNSPDGTDDDSDDAPASAAERMTTHIDTVVADMVLRVDAPRQREGCHDGT